MAKLQKGDLVMMPRRKNPGLGIVLETMSDAYASLGIPRAAHTLAASGRDRRFLDADIHHSLRYHLTYSSKHKSFCHIHWFKKPSFYEVNHIREDETWEPIKWVKKLS